MEEEKLQKMLNEQTQELKSDYLRQGKFLLEQFEKKTLFIAEQYGDLKKKTDATFDKIGEISQRLDKNEITQKIITKKLDATFEMTGKLTEDMSFVKDKLRIIRNELKVKVGRDEFSILEKRVLILEKKLV